MTEQVYQDERYCCMDCGCEWFVVQEGLRDRCNSCGSLRDTKRGPNTSAYSANNE